MSEKLERENFSINPYFFTSTSITYIYSLILNVENYNLVFNILMSLQRISTVYYCILENFTLYIEYHNQCDPIFGAISKIIVPCSQ